MWHRKLWALLVTDPLIIVATAVMGSISLFVSVFDASGRSQHKVAQSWSRLLLRISGVRVRVEGLDKIAPGGSYLFVSNHRSYMDVPVILSQIPVQFRFLANKNLFAVPFIGYHLKRAGHLAVNNANPRESLKSMSEAARVIQQRGVSILIFPEGGRTDGEMRPFKDGAAYVAIKAGVPVVPIALIGMRDILPMGSGYVFGGDVTMCIGDPLPTIDLTLHDRTRFSQALHERIVELHEGVQLVEARGAR